MKRFFGILVIFLVISLTLSQNFSLASQSFALVPETLGIGEITTLVGSDRAFGDGGPALQASLNAPKAMIFDKAGNLLVADTNNHRVRKINLTTGEITTIAGIGTAGFTGDGEPAARTKLNFPNGLAIDERGNIFISDSANHRIRRVDVDSSVITTVAGNGESGQDRDNVLATQTSLTNPFSLTVDKSGNIYVLQLESFRVRRIDSSSRMITTFAGNGKAGVSRDGEIAASTSIIPVAINIDNQNNLLI
ncbi:MAG: SMP-30/gluconolactonase/LRE family protein, partial [Blastocatellia bacterium]